MREPHTKSKNCLNDNPIEQASDFKYIGYFTSDYRSDLVDKLQTFNKRNGIIQRHFGKQVSKETKLRIHSITDKAAFKFDSEAWVLRKETNKD